MKSTILRAKNWLSSQRKSFPLAFDAKRYQIYLQTNPDQQNPNSEINMAISIGVEAPDFTLQTKNAEGLKDAVLSASKDRVTSFSFSSRLPSPAFARKKPARFDDLSSYEELDAQVLGISVDSPFAQEAMALKEGLNFPLVSDFNKNASKAYGVLYEDFIGFEGVSKGRRS